MVYPRKVLHLTVSPEGEISLWDDRERAMLGKGTNDMYVPFLLSLFQTEKLKEAQKKANETCSEEPRILEEIQVEELAIDGICGVY